MTVKITFIFATVFLLSVIAFSAVKKAAFIDISKCIQCGTCFKNCPVKAISKIEKDGKLSYIIDPKKCIACGLCVKNCPKKAIQLIVPGGVKDAEVNKPDSAATPDTTAHISDSVKVAAETGAEQKK